MPALDESNPAPLVRVELRSTMACGLPQRFILRTDAGSVAIGFNNCRHVFSLGPGESYAVALSAIDPAGNRSTAAGPVFISTPDEASVPILHMLHTQTWLELLLGP